MIRMKTAVVAFLTFCVAHIVNATDLRGRVDAIHAYSPSPFPMANVQVTIMAVQPTPMGVTYVPYLTTVTGIDGMYYFRNANPGNFVLHVAGTNYPLQILSQPAQDIQAILLRF